MGVNWLYYPLWISWKVSRGKDFRETTKYWKSMCK